MSYRQEIPQPGPPGSLVANVLGYGAFGFAARCLQLGIMKRPLFSGPSGHVISTGVWAAFGYYAYHLEIKMEDVIWEKRKEIAERRAVRQEAIQALSAEA
ncbi:hypothetical protein CYLTODRAFT_421008 [Cylindrobasidium torrendii FP15055 ss-10]|uniref:Uncharacterized protein n=1 Tax=Cylindrobasidium torrendii FP15055 ss-10 TaxID=1314674 RepID=A0A0D7BEW4_9AGAR|nr:hypothetical protein CYLTODRAFT_421008 [Cylindrobasidium torrendii FP15055 ss-10]